MHGEVDGLDARLYVVVKGGLPELLILPNGVVLNEGVGELRDAHGQLPAEDSSQRQNGGGDAELVHIGVVLKGRVHQPHDHVELLVVEQHLGVNEVVDGSFFSPFLTLLYTCLFIDGAARIFLLFLSFASTLTSCKTR